LGQDSNAAVVENLWIDVLGRPHRWLRDAGIGALVSVWIAFLGPFGSFHTSPLVTRALYFISLLLPCLLIYRPTMRLAGRWGDRFGLSLWLAIPMAIVLASVPFSILVYVVAPKFFPQLQGVATMREAYVETLILMLPAAGGYAIAEQLLARRRFAASTDTATRESPKSPPPDDVSTSPLSRRLPHHLGHDIVAVHAEDHYVRIYTALGSHLIPMRFRDALGELGDKQVGVKVHRSWWVAAQAIADVSGRGRKLHVRLVTGLEAPVARTAIAEIKAIVRSASRP